MFLVVTRAEMNGGLGSECNYRYGIEIYVCICNKTKSRPLSFGSNNATLYQVGQFFLSLDQTIMLLVKKYGDLSRYSSVQLELKSRSIKT